DYCPYWKWMHHEFLKAPGQAQLASLLDDLVYCHEQKSQITLVSRICALERELLYASGIVEDTGARSLFTVFRLIRQQILAVKSTCPAWYSEPGDRTFDRLLE
ncbi:MAG: hypothetical protein WCJ56_11510, partial [bacterium]